MDQQSDYDFWHCGHIAFKADGFIVKDGNLRPPHITHNHDERVSYGEVCPRCWTYRLSHRVQGIKNYPTLWNFDHGHIHLAISKLEALKRYMLGLAPLPSDQLDNRNFPNYPLEATNMLDIVAGLVTDSWNAAVDDYTDARSTVRLSTARHFTELIEEICDNAAEWYKKGNAAVKDCLRSLMYETDDMLAEISASSEEETKLIAGLNANYEEVMRIHDQHEKARR
ncbi:hypothetical protein HD806DRAFT_548913 [Xylariaceae sp. AK1471]|nr:hypothetical protein HD806DRAFT_548913 [Xylariaceae sp. AK1471]